MARDSSAAMSDFFKRIREIDPEGIILMLGDHSPHSIDSLLKDLKVRPQISDAELFKTPLLTANLGLPEDQWIRFPHFPSLIYRKLGLAPFSSISDLYHNPNLGNYNYNQLYHPKSEFAKNCTAKVSEKASDCKSFLDLKKAFGNILYDHFFGNQILSF